MSSFSSGIPDDIKDFIFDLHDACRRSQRADEMSTLYSSTFVQLSNKYFSTTPWPSASLIASECESDPLFLTFYSELTLRHTFTHLRPTLEDKINSWNTYVKLFEEVIKSENDTFMILPEWAFEVCNEFVYQFQGFCQYRHATAFKGEVDEKPSKMMRENPNCWELKTVMKLLNGVIDMANLKSDPTGKSAPSQMHHVLGYFASISLSRLSCLLGDFQGSLNAYTSASINIWDFKNGLHTTLLAAHLSLCYHAGVSMMALGRCRDARHILTQICHLVRRDLKRGKEGQEQFAKLEHKMIALVTVLVGMGGQGKIDDTIMRGVNERFGDKLHRIQTFEDTFTDLYTFGCPKFISPSIPSFTTSETGVNKSGDFYKRQVKIQNDRAVRVRDAGRTRNTMRLYSTVSTGKIGRLVRGDGGVDGGDGDGEREAEDVGNLCRLKLYGLQVEEGRKVGFSDRDKGEAVDMGAPVMGQGEVNFHVVGEEVRVEGGRKEAKTHWYFIKNIMGDREERRDFRVNGGI